MLFLRWEELGSWHHCSCHLGASICLYSSLVDDLALVHSSLHVGLDSVDDL